MRKGSDASSAVDLHADPGDEAGFVGGKIQRRVGNVLWRAEAADRNRADELRLHFLGFLAAHEFLQHRRQARQRIEGVDADAFRRQRSEEHTSELQSLMRISYAVFCL